MIELVPFNRPYVPPITLDLIRESLASHKLSGDGPMTRRSVEQMQRICGAGEHLLTPSCTHALELACRLLHLGPGDEVIIPSFNFPSAATAVALCGATPVFVDVDFKTKNVTRESIQAGITANTRAVIVVHYAGVLCAMNEILSLLSPLGIAVIEDAAHSFGIESSMGIAGSFGVMSTYSFHETKNLQCGEGGALQINDPTLVERAEVLREKGTNRRQFFRGQVAKYSWVDHGSSWLLADPLAAMLYAQLLHFREIQQSRVDSWNRYASELAEWAVNNDFELPWVSEEQQNSAHMFYLVAPSLEVRDDFISHMRSFGVSAVFHYQPLHSSLAGQRLGRSGRISNSGLVGDRLVRLPLWTKMESELLESSIAVALQYRHRGG